MQLVESRQGGALVVALEGRLDSASCSNFEKTMIAHLDAGAKHIVLDLSKLEYVSSAGLRSMLVAAKKSAGASSRIAVSGLTGNVLQVFEIAGFRSYFTVFPSAEEAVKASA